MDFAIGLESLFVLNHCVRSKLQNFWGSWHVKKASGNTGFRFMERSQVNYYMFYEYVLVIPRKK